MAKNEFSSSRVSNLATELHELLSEDDMTHIEVQFQVKQVLHQGVTYEEFLEIIEDVLPFPMPISTDHLKSIFMKIDSYNSGIIEWNGFITYILTALQRDQAASLHLESALNTSYRKVSGPNRDVIRRIDLMPQVNPKTGEISYLSYRYVTASKDGIVAVWSQKWKLQKYKICVHRTTVATKQVVFPWILDMVCIPNAQMIATCSTDETIRFYDIINANMDLLIIITKIDAIVTSMHFWFDTEDLEQSVLVFGDSLGGVSFLEFNKAVSGKLFGLTTGYDIQKIDLIELVKNPNEFVIAHSYPALHDEWVRQIRYIPELKSFLSCSISSNISMILHSTFFNIDSSRNFMVSKGISSFDYSSVHNIIISGSIDRCLRIWNPYINKKPIAIMSGHSAPVSHVMIIDEMFQAISISEDKCIKVWDLKEQCCIQTLYDRNYKWGNHPITSAMHNSVHRFLLLGSISVVVIERIWSQESTDKTIYASHTNPLTDIAYSKIYNYMVSTSENGAIIFWDLESGQKKVKVSLSHSILVDGLDVPVAITAMALDEQGRRVFTAGGDGLLKLWSMTNGSFIRSIKLPEGKDINAILACKDRVFFGGWTKRVYVCNDELHLETLKMWPIHHSDDIMAITHIAPSMIATASWDGKIMLWMLETGQQISAISLQNQFFFYYLPKLRILAESRIIGTNALDLLEFTPGMSFGEMSEKPELFVKVVKKRSKRGKSLQRESGIFFPALTCILSLPTRLDKPIIGSIIVSDTDGYIQLWPTARTGGIIAIFCNITVPEQYTSCITTDKANKYLFTGDTSGYIRVWYIKYYYSGELHTDRKKMQEDMRPFPFSKKRLQPAYQRVLKEFALMKPKEHLKFANFDSPKLISSFRGHLMTIVKIVLVEDKKIFLSASRDMSIRIWTYSGAYLKTLGDVREWSLSKALSTPILPQDRKVPADITKVASGPTLQVIFQGVSPHWYRLRQIILYSYIKSVSRKKTGAPEEVKVTKKVTIAQQKRAQEFIFSQMKTPLGKNFTFKQTKRDKPALPILPATYKEMNCAYAYLEPQKLDLINLDPLYRYLEGHYRFAARLKPSTYDRNRVWG